MKVGIERGGRALSGVLRRPEGSTMPEGLGYGRACSVSEISRAALRAMFVE